MIRECTTTELVDEITRLRAENADLRARMNEARCLECFAERPVCQCCVEMVERLYPEGPTERQGAGDRERE